MEYPTDEELEKIRTWNPSDFHGLMAYVKDRWKYADSGYWSKRGNTYKISTAGWSGNEDIISAMHKNHVWWVLYFYSERRGGHFVFKPSPIHLSKKR